MNNSPIDVDRTTYHETDDGIWKIVSGTDYGDVWDIDFFEDHAAKYIEKEFDGDLEDLLEERIRRESENGREILEAELRGRRYTLFREENEETGVQDFHFLFYKETDDVDNPAQYIDRIWENEIETVLSETARSKMTAKHELMESDDEYMNRLSRKI